jgi:hypothetical protein
VVLDCKASKRKKDKKRYASMSREQKDELNKKARDRRAEKKGRDQENKREEGTYNLLMKGLLIRTLCM